MYMYMFEDEVVENRLGEALEAELSKPDIKEKQNILYIHMILELHMKHIGIRKEILHMKF